jgi:hypothetical protein
LTSPVVPKISDSPTDVMPMISPNLSPLMLLWRKRRSVSETASAASPSAKMAADVAFSSTRISSVVRSGSRSPTPSGRVSVISSTM